MYARAVKPSARWQPSVTSHVVSRQRLQVPSAVYNTCASAGARGRRRRSAGSRRRQMASSGPSRPHRVTKIRTSCRRARRGPSRTARTWGWRGQAYPQGGPGRLQAHFPGRKYSAAPPLPRRQSLRPISTLYDLAAPQLSCRAALSMTNEVRGACTWSESQTRHPTCYKPAAAVSHLVKQAHYSQMDGTAQRRVRGLPTAHSCDEPHSAHSVAPTPWQIQPRYDTLPLMDRRGQHQPGARCGRLGPTWHSAGTFPAQARITAPGER